MRYREEGMKCILRGMNGLIYPYAWRNTKNRRGVVIGIRQLFTIAVKNDHQINNFNAAAIFPCYPRSSELP